MMKIILALVVSIVFFGVGLVGTYMAMPTIAPDMVEETQSRLDSLAMAEEMMALPDSLRMAAGMDSMAMGSAMAMPGAPVNEALNTLRDSISILEAQLSTEQAEQVLLKQRVEDIEKKWEDLESKFNDAREISGTIVKLEDGELAALLDQIDPVVLEAIYLEATARNRARLLQMLPAEKAAVIVNKMASPRPKPNTTATAAANANALLGNQEIP